MTVLTREQFVSIMPGAEHRVDIWLAPLNAALEEWQIDTVQRLVEFVPQLAHESGSFRYTQELASGAAYEGRLDLGNDEPGDGVKYKGHGPMQITGKRNHMLCAAALDIAREHIVDFLLTPAGGCRAAGWFWRVGAGLNLSKRAIASGVPVGCDLNDLADRSDFERITLAINGGLNGLADRQAYRTRAQEVLA